MARTPITEELLKGFFTKEQLKFIVGGCLLENRELKKNQEILIRDQRELKNTIASLNTRVTDLSHAISRLKADKEGE